MLSELTDIPREKLTVRKIEELCTEYELGGYASYADVFPPYDNALELNNSGYVLGGVFRSDKSEVYFVCKSEESQQKYFLTNGLYEYPVLLLSGTVKDDVEAIRELLAPYGTVSDDNPEQLEGNAICSYFEIILNSADRFLSDFGTIAGSYYWTVMLAVLALLIVFVTFAVQKNKYAIGVLKSVGTPDGAIAVVYGASVILIISVALALAIAGSRATVAFINGVFSNTAGLTFSFFSFRFSAALKSAAIAYGATLPALLVTFIVFLTRKPVKLKSGG